MAHKPLYKTKQRRRREGRTDYHARLKLLQGRKTRLVVRPSNKNMVAQFVEYSPNGDKTLFSASSTELRKLGWKYSCSSTPAAYLTGLLLASKAKGKVKDLVLDIGLKKAVKGAKVFAVAKAVADSGINLPLGDIAPSEDRITGKHITDYAKSLSGDQLRDRFGKTIKAGADPTKITEQFKSLKEKLGAK